MAGLVIRAVTCVPLRVKPGGQVNIFFQVVDAESGALSASTGSIQLSSGNKAIQQAWAAVSVLIAGRYQYTYEVPTSVPVGWWTVELKTASGEAEVEVPWAFEVR